MEGLDSEAAAEVAYTESYQLNAAFVPNLVALGKLHFRQRKWDDSLKTLQAALLNQMNIESDTMKVDIFYHMGMLRVELQDLRRARDMFSRALAINSQHGPSKAAMDEINL